MSDKSVPDEGGRPVEFVMPVLLIGIAGYLWTVADEFRGGAQRYELIGPAFVPKLLLGILVVLCLAQIVAVLLRMRSVMVTSNEQTHTIFWSDLAVAISIALSYLVALDPVGFLITTPIFQVAFLAFVFRSRDLRTLVLVPAGLTIAITAIFIGVLNAPLPRGRGLFGEFSRLFY